MEVNKKTIFIKDWILNYVNSMPKKAQSLVIGVSGGIDSSVVSAVCALTGKKTIVLSNFKHEERQGEKQFFKEWFLQNGYRVVELPDSIAFEGEGDALFFKDVLFMGCGFRTDPEAHTIISKALNVDVVTCELVNPQFYHLDTCFLPIQDRIIYYRDAFSNFSQNLMIKKLIEKYT